MAAVRTSMEELIAQVRGNIGDSSGVDQVFTNSDIQDVLDARRRDAFQEPLTTIYTRVYGGQAQSLDFFADGGSWETDVILYDPYFSVLTSSSTPIYISASDYNVGRWTMSANQLAPVRITGKQYDINGASADLLDMWISQVALEFDFLSGGRTFKRSQQIEGLNQAISKFRARQWLGYSVMTRMDMNG